MKATVFSDGGELSLEQIDVLEKLRKRFPELQYEVLPADSDEAADAGILVPPGLVIDGLTLSVGRVLSPGRVRRFLVQHGGEGEGPA
jgi:hypothetical protein